jgi:hypothetical protein
MQVAVIGDGERIHAQRLHPVQQLRNAISAVEQGIFAVRVEMNECHRGCGEDTGGSPHCQNE